MKKLLLVIVGPTAVGKTTLAINLAKYFNTEIVSADSRQFYKELNIGTAKPTKKELRSVKHHLINNISILKDYNISEFEKDAINSIDSIFKNNNLAILVGGSGLYIDTILYGIDNIPKVDLVVREKLNIQFKKKGLKFIQDKLKKLDLEYYKKIDLNNYRRIIRALEVCISTGQPFSSYLKLKERKSRYNTLIIGLKKERKVLHQLINYRVDKMIENGLINEVRSVEENRKLNALNTIGYKEIFNYLEGKCSLEKAIENIKTNSRRYAKRQLTWFNANKNIVWHEGEFNTDKIIESVHRTITQQSI